MSRLIVSVLALALCGVVNTGCLQTRQGVKPRNGDPYARRFKKEDEIDLPRSWTRIGSGIESKPRHVGYMSTEQTRVDGEVIPVFWIYDLDFHKIGFVLERGETYRKNRHDKFVQIGVFPYDEAIGTLLSAPLPINYYTMPPPEGSDAPYQDPFRGINKTKS